MSPDQVDSILGDELVQKLSGNAAPAPTAPVPGAPAHHIPTKEETKGNPFAGGDIPGARDFIKKLEAARLKLPWAAQLVTPADVPEAMAMLSGGFMGPAKNLAEEGAVPAYRFARNALSRIATSALAGGAGAKLEGDKTFALGALKGGGMGIFGEGLGYGGKAIGSNRLENYMVNKVPENLSAVAQKFAPWMPSFKTPKEFVHAIGHWKAQGRGAGAIASERYQGVLDDIDSVLAQNGARAFAPRPIDPKLKIRTPQTFEEATDTLDLLGQIAFDKKALRKRGVTPNAALKARQALRDDLENHLGNFQGPNGQPLDELYSDANKNYARVRSFGDFLDQPNVISNGRLNRQPLQAAFQSFRKAGSDLDAQWQPGELDELEQSLFGSAGPTATDVPARSSRLRVGYRLGPPHVFAEPPHLPVFVGEKPFRPYVEPQAAHYVGGRVASAALGNAPGRQQDVVMPEEQEQQGGISAGGDITPEILQQAQQHPDLQGLSEDELRELYRQAQR